MADENPSLEERVRQLELREAARDVKVEVATSALNRLAAIVGAAGVALVGAVAAFLLGVGGAS